MAPITFAVGPVPGEPVPLHPQHPSMHGGYQLHCELDGDLIASAKVEVGFVHRSAEKLLEVRDYRQGAMLANRHIWTSPTAGEYAYVLAAEELLALTVSRRADQLRLIYCEIDRILSHLSFLGPALGRLCASREALADFMAITTGARMHHQVIRIGGVASDLDADAAMALMTILDKVAIDVESLTDSEVINSAVGVGVVGEGMINGFGISGPIARAAGIARDERTTGYGAYENFKPAVRFEGDGAARYLVMLDEISASRSLISTTIKELEPGELLLRTPRNLRLPEGESHRAVEGGLGRNGVSLFSTGGLAPARVRLRTASFAHFHALEMLLVGLHRDDLMALLASWPVIAGDADR